MYANTYSLQRLLHGEKKYDADVHVHFASSDSVANHAADKRLDYVADQPDKPNQRDTMHAGRLPADEALLINNRVAQIYTSAAGERRVYQIVYNRQRCTRTAAAGPRGRVGLTRKRKTETTSVRNQLVDVGRSHPVSAGLTPHDPAVQ